MFLAIYICLTLVVLTLSIIATWKLFVKAGRYGWLSLIPVVNLLVLIKVSRTCIVGTVSVLLGAILSLLAAVKILPEFLLFVGIGLILFYFIFMFMKLFRRFELSWLQSILFAIFVPIVGLFVCSFNPYIEYDFG